jgi:SAM-dependent methyltransferase
MGPEQFDVHALLEREHWWFTARRHIVEQVIHSLLPPGTGRGVVDVGCGTGANLGSLADRYTCTGIDPSAQAIAYAQHRYPDVNFVCGIAPHDLGEAAAAADLILLMDVLEHVAEDRQLLAGLVAVAKPGAHLLLTVPADMALWSAHDVSFGHYRRYDRLTLERVWTGLPVAVKMLSYFNARLYPVVKMVRVLSQWRGRAGGYAGTDLSRPPRLANRILHATFAGESKRLLACLEGQPGGAYRSGVSLIAVLEKTRR